MSDFEISFPKCLLERLGSRKIRDEFRHIKEIILEHRELRIEDVARHLETFKEITLQHHERHKEFESSDVAALKAEGDRCRQEFLERACLEPPSQVRLIDCHATCTENRVVLVDWCTDEDMEFAAISHTFGMDVYAVFDCECATKCLTKVPRCSGIPCPTHDGINDSTHNRVIHDILNMCAILRSAGVEYAWHDGVCIAQHDNAEVDDTIKHIGWIYSHARETIIFLHYIGNPMAPISMDEDYGSRWQTRVWTVQEAALSKLRRYCIRVGNSSGSDGKYLGECKSLQELEDKIAGWYTDGRVTVIEEEEYWKIILELYLSVFPLAAAPGATNNDTVRMWSWCVCIEHWVHTLIHTCFQFPTVGVALQACSFRDSKHEGDRINSILALAGVKDFVAPKDGNMEASTMEFFKRQGQQGLARAVFTANVGSLDPDYGSDRHTHAWLPMLSSPLLSVYESVKEHSSKHEGIEGAQVHRSMVENWIEFTVLQDGRLEMKGEMLCVAVSFRFIGGAPMQEDLTTHVPRGNMILNVIPDRDRAPTVNVDPAYMSTPIAMDLFFDQHGFSAVLAQASSLALGTAMVPMIIEDEEGSEHIGPLDLYAAAVSVECSGALAEACTGQKPGWMAIWKAASVIKPGAGAKSAGEAAAQVPAVKLGLALFPTVILGQLAPVVQGRELPEMESFWVHMVLPLQPLLQRRASMMCGNEEVTPDRTTAATSIRDRIVPAILVQGDLKAPAAVAKVGCFEAGSSLLDVLSVGIPCLTKLHKLVLL